MAVILIGFLLIVLMIGSNRADINENCLCQSNFLSLIHVITDDRTQRLLNEAEVKKEFRGLEERTKILGEKVNNITSE